MNSKQRKTARFTANHFLVVFLAVLIGVQVFIANRIATQGKTLSRLEAEARLLEDQNRKLLSENVEYMSLHTLYQKAYDMGFVESESIVNLNPDSKDLALNHLP